MKKICIFLIFILTFMACSEKINDNTPRTNYITLNSFRVKWEKNIHDIEKDIVYHVLMFTDKKDYDIILSRYINNNYVNLFNILFEIESVKNATATIENSIEFKGLDKNTLYYICIIEVDRIENIYNFYPLTYAETSTAFFIKKLFEEY